MKNHWRAAMISMMAAVTGCQKDAPRPEAARAPAASAPTSAAIEVVPNESIGPLRLGAARSDVDALGLLRVHPRYSGMTVPYTVGYDAAGHVDKIQVSMLHASGEVRVGGVTIPHTATLAQARQLLGDCIDSPPAEGGTTSVCRGGAVTLSVGSGSIDELWVAVSRPR